MYNAGDVQCTFMPHDHNSHTLYSNYMPSTLGYSDLYNMQNTVS